MRKCVVVLSVVVCAFVPAVVCGQGIGGTIHPGAFQFVSEARIGYKSLGLNFNVDSPVTQVTSPFLVAPQWGSLLETFPLSFRLPAAALAIGEINLKVLTPRGLDFFFGISGSIPRSVTTQTTVGPGIGTLVPQAADWKSSRIQWYGLDLGGSYRVAPRTALIAGLKLDCTSVRFSDPHPDGSYSYLVFPLGPIENTLDNYAGDLRTNLTIPYVGLQFLGPQLRGNLKIGLAGTHVLLPLRLTDGGVYFASFLFGLTGRADISEEASFTLRNAGLYLDGGLEMDVNVTDGWRVTFWAQGSFMQAVGSGAVDLAGQSSAAILPLLGGFVFPPTSYSASSDGRSTVRQASLSLGISGVLNF